MARVIVGMSGGVDSAVAAYLLKEQGYDVIGATLLTLAPEDGGESKSGEIEDAKRIAQRLDIPHYTIRCADEFDLKVIQPFIDEYLRGRTPNPCVECNHCLKWARMQEFAKEMQADFIATGHYANIVTLPDGRVTVRKALHDAKDQTYMLYRLSQDQLKMTLMPLGSLAKDQVRELAKKAELPVASKPDSQEICFVTEGHYADFIETHAKAGIPGQGNFVDEDGKVLGTHKGITHYTVGQRKGLGIALGYPAYVREIRADKDEIVLGREESLYSRVIICERVNLLSIPAFAEGEKIPCAVRIRYHHAGQAALIEGIGEDLVRITFEQPVRAATPGQSAVFYDGDGCVIGGGIISEIAERA